MTYCIYDTCPIDGARICCMECASKDNCTERCNNSECKYFKTETKTGLTAFKSNSVAVINTITEIEQQKKALEEKSKSIREQLQQAMEKYGIMKFENDAIKLTYVAPTTRSTLDSAKLKKEMPEIAQKYTKTSNVKASVRIEVK